MQDESKTIVDLGDEFIGFGGNQGERLKVCSIRPLPCLPNAGEGERAGLGQSDVEDALDGLGVSASRAGFGTWLHASYVEVAQNTVSFAPQLVAANVSV